MEDYYDVLGVPCDASDEQLRQAYRKMAMRWHPDKNPDSREVATRRFQQVSQAYQTLSDPQRRSAYDDWKRGGRDTDATSSQHMDPHDLFNQFFAHVQAGRHPGEAFFTSFEGGRMGMASSWRSAPAQIYELPMTLEDVFRGGQTRVGAHCVTVPPGVDEGALLTSDDGRAAFIVRTKPHPHFERRRLDLVHYAVISMWQFWRGCLYNVHTIDKRTVSVRFAARSWRAVVMQNFGLGGASSSKRGNLIVCPCLVHPRIVEAIKALAKSAFTFVLFLFCVRHPELLYILGSF